MVWLSVLSAAASDISQAAPVMVEDALNSLNITSVQNFVDAGSPGFSVGDIFYGVLNIENISSGGVEQWGSRNVLGNPIDTFTGYYLAQIKSVFTGYPASSPYAAAVTLGAGNTDPNGIFSAAELATGAAFKLYIDNGPGATAFETNGSIADDIAKATDGAFWGTLGFPGSNGYWAALAMKNGVVFGAGGIDSIISADDTRFAMLNDPSCPSCAPVNSYFSTVARDTGVNSTWRFSGNTNAVLQPSAVPEPNTLSLLALGGLWLSARRSKRR